MSRLSDKLFSAIPFLGDTGSGGSAGLVPKPAAGDAEKVLLGKGLWSSILTGLTIQTGLLKDAILQSYREKEVTIGATSGTINLDLSLGTVFLVSPASGAAITFTVSNLPQAGYTGSWTIILTNGATPPTITWVTGTKWPGGAAPTLSASGVDVIGYSLVDSAYRAAMAMKDSK